MNQNLLNLITLVMIFYLYKKIDYVKETMVNTEINKLLVNGLMKIPGNLEVTGEIKSCTASGRPIIFQSNNRGTEQSCIGFLMELKESVLQPYTNGEMGWWGSHFTINQGNLKIRNDLQFVGGNNWVIHTPDDKRTTLYIAQSKTYGKEDWDWPNAMIKDRMNLYNPKLRSNVLDTTNVNSTKQSSSDMEAIRNLSQFANELTKNGRLTIPGGLEVKGDIRACTASGRPIILKSSNKGTEQSSIGFYNGTTRTSVLQPYTNGEMGWWGSHFTINQGNLKIRGDLVFNGGNNWVIHTPDDKRSILYIAQSKTYGKEDWDWDNAMTKDRMNLYNPKMTVKSMQVNGNHNIRGDLVFNGGNNWVIHTPDDNRSILYLVQSKTYGKKDWDWGNAMTKDRTQLFNPELRSSKVNISGSNEYLLTLNKTGSGQHNLIDFRYQGTRKQRFGIDGNSKPWYGSLRGWHP